MTKQRKTRADDERTGLTPPPIRSLGRQIFHGKAEHGIEGCKAKLTDGGIGMAKKGRRRFEHRR